MSNLQQDSIPLSVISGLQTTRRRQPTSVQIHCLSAICQRERERERERVTVLVMGNCLVNSSSGPGLYTHHMNGSLSTPSALHFKNDFTPILPFSTRSNLASLYALGHELGRGQYGIIRSCTCRASGTLFACKSIPKVRLSSDREIKDVIREVHVMKHLSNSDCSSADSIVRLHEPIEDKAFIHLILEICQGGDLYERIVKNKCYSEAHAAFIMNHLLQSVQFCHGMGIMHRDIKPENILLINNSDTSPIKLADFGLALEFSRGQKFSGLAGSSYYIAPEVLQGEYSKEIDIWSAGVIMYILLGGAPPFWGATEQRIFKAIQKGELRFPSKPWDTISTSAKDLIARMLHPDAKLRITLAQALSHPWILHHAKDSRPNLVCNDVVLSDHSKGAGAFSLHTLAVAPTCHPTSIGGVTDPVKADLNKIMVHLIASMDRDDVTEIKWQNGWTCTISSRNANEQMVLVDTRQDKYLVTHDKARKRISWKLLSEKPATAK